MGHSSAARRNTENPTGTYNTASCIQHIILLIVLLCVVFQHIPWNCLPYQVSVSLVSSISYGTAQDGTMRILTPQARHFALLLLPQLLLLPCGCCSADRVQRCGSTAQNSTAGVNFATECKQGLPGVEILYGCCLLLMVTADSYEYLEYKVYLVHIQHVVRKKGWSYVEIILLL